jgi:hypothetical protein
MAQKFTYDIVLKVQREGPLTLPIADVRVQGTLDPGKDFAGQLEKAVAEHLARIQLTLEKARRQ